MGMLQPCLERRGPPLRRVGELSRGLPTRLQVQYPWSTNFHTGLPRPVLMAPKEPRFMDLRGHNGPLG